MKIATALFCLALGGSGASASSILLDNSSIVSFSDFGSSGSMSAGVAQSLFAESFLASPLGLPSSTLSVPQFYSYVNTSEDSLYQLVINVYMDHAFSLSGSAIFPNPGDWTVSLASASALPVTDMSSSFYGDYVETLTLSGSDPLFSDSSVTLETVLSFDKSQDQTVTFQPVVVPEPGCLGLLALGGTALLWARRQTAPRRS